MLAEAAEAIPTGAQLVYEPKWDGFRCIVFRSNEALILSSRTGKPLEKYFPELVAALNRALPSEAIVDGEIILPTEKGLDFETLQMRIHPAASRIEKLSKAFPTAFVAFDLLALGDEDLRDRPFFERRQRLLAALVQNAQVRLTPQTSSVNEATRWFHEFEGAGCDGVMARDNGMPYRAGERVMTKIKHHHTVDCVVAAYRPAKVADQVASLLLGLYDEQRVLHYIGHTASFSASQKRALHQQLSALHGDNPFVGGRAPLEQSRWKKEVSVEPTWLKPELVCEVRYDFLSGPRFRHAATFIGFREDKAALDCHFRQLLPVKAFSLDNVWSSPIDADSV